MRPCMTGLTPLEALAREYAKLTLPNAHPLLPAPPDPRGRVVVLEIPG